ncbi:Uncharacterised protein [Mycobacteroides abscessus subsp. abscessus]|nr:Uncharacterised protein [Mycobacteroides abscessus subsp. abscessus]SKT61261.1 Uncharacterised protein [Mycobacteroides abscessus subsp. abscessus]
MSDLSSTRTPGALAVPKAAASPSSRVRRRSEVEACTPSRTVAANPCWPIFFESAWRASAPRSCATPVHSLDTVDCPAADGWFGGVWGVRRGPSTCWITSCSPLSTVVRACSTDRVEATGSIGSNGRTLEDKCTRRVVVTETRSLDSKGTTTAPRTNCSTTSRTEVAWRRGHPSRYVTPVTSERVSAISCGAWGWAAKCRTNPSAADSRSGSGQITCCHTNASAPCGALMAAVMAALRHLRVHLPGHLPQPHSAAIRARWHRAAPCQAVR